MATRRVKNETMPSDVVSVAVAAQLLGRTDEDVEFLLRTRILTPVKRGKSTGAVRLADVLEIRREFWSSLAELAVQFIRAVEHETLDLALEETEGATKKGRVNSRSASS
ncbi:hypothetical protein BTHE68_41100 [Burkholderia sp. THE68]|uniref:hypothetical protein n=1 Tax=Burkholderia sp. THE68 TaxID=758782 RepID=UPI0013195792|nr:hypothetical protein [Burkholderia sp. THE68]BBU30376.1 hypothetical protein BTHE68_41100 [Burkholderia sp. THE68]